MVMVITSPPYMGMDMQVVDPARQLERIRKAVESGQITGRESVRVAKSGMNPHTVLGQSGDYGATEGQIGALKEGNMTLTYTDIKVPTEDWYGCYDGGWQAGHLTDDSFSHPAKMAKGLVYKIVREGLQRGWWTKEDTIIDPFGGIGSTGIACSAYGIRSISVELEPRFCRMAAGYDCPGVTKAEWVRWYARKQQARNTGNRFCPTCLDGLKYKKNSGIIPTSEAHRYVGNFELHTKAWAAMGYPQPVILQGDSRFLLEVIQQAGGVVTSPPFMTVNNAYNPEFTTVPHDSTGRFRGTYGTTPGQIGAMPSGAITSPPFSPDGNQPVIGQGTRKDLKEQGRSPDAQNMQTDGNIAAMPISVVTSPPYEKGGVQVGTEHHPERIKGSQSGMGNYGDIAPENLANTQGNDYESACRLVYLQLYQIMAPGGVMACVVKPFVKQGKLVDLPGMTLGWLIDVGFEAVLWINAKVVAPAEQLDMFSDQNDVKERKSFFRQLHEKRCVHRSAKAVDGAYQCQLQNIACNFYKAAKVQPEWAPKDCGLYLNNKMLGLGIDAEVCLIVRKPGEGGGTSVVTSPPFMESLNREGEWGKSLDPQKNSYPQNRSAEYLARHGNGYGNTPGQIGNMPSGRLTTDRD